MRFFSGIFIKALSLVLGDDCDRAHGLRMRVLDRLFDRAGLPQLDGLVRAAGQHDGDLGQDTHAPHGTLKTHNKDE